MDGPYSLSNVMVDTMMADKPFPVLYFAPYMLVTMNLTYSIYPDPASYIAFPYDITVAPLINGYFSGATVDAQMPPSGKPADMLLPSVALELKGHTGQFYGAIALNDLVPTIPPGNSWKPGAIINLIHGERDDCVPIGNLTYARNYFSAVQFNNYVNSSFDTIYVNLPGFTKHVLYCPFAMGMAWEWLHGLNH
jgi:hypothetical protein